MRREIVRDCIGKDNKHIDEFLQHIQEQEQEEEEDDNDDDDENETSSDSDDDWFHCY